LLLGISGGERPFNPGILRKIPGLAGSKQVSAGSSFLHLLAGARSAMPFHHAIGHGNSYRRHFMALEADGVIVAIVAIVWFSQQAAADEKIGQSFPV
jgi:hypothetical protein